MSNSVHLSVILPSYMEEENLRLLLPRLTHVLEQFHFKSEILVVDTTRPLDATQDACKINRVRYLNRIPNNDFGDAVRTGISRAQGEWILFMDADGSHFPEFIPHLLEKKAEFDLVIASRYIDGGFTENTLLLRMMSQVLNWTYGWILNLRMKDISNSFKLYRASYLRDLELKCKNFDIIEEILFKLVKKNPGLRYVEVPFTFKKRMFGETKRNLLVFVLTYLCTIIRLRFSE